MTPSGPSGPHGRHVPVTADHATRPSGSLSIKPLLVVGHGALSGGHEHEASALASLSPAPVAPARVSAMAASLLVALALAPPLLAPSFAAAPVPPLALTNARLPAIATKLDLDL